MAVGGGGDIGLCDAEDFGALAWVRWRLWTILSIWAASSALARYSSGFLMPRSANVAAAIFDVNCAFHG